MHLPSNLTGHLRYYLSLLVLFLLPVKNQLFAQYRFEDFLDSAIANNSALVSLKAQRKYLKLESDMLAAMNLAPEIFLSSDFMFTPYFNNNGKLVTTSPGENAIGYDVGITNGGLYSFLVNIEYTLFNFGPTNHLVSQNMVEIQKTDTQIKTVELELEHALANRYLDVLEIQTGLQNARENLDLLSKQFEIVKTLTKHGLYRFIDYKLMETALRTDSIDYLRAETSYRLNMKQLKTACGITDTSVSSLAVYEVKPLNSKDDHSVFLTTYSQDSLAAAWQLRVFEDKYGPVVKLYANSGLNSTSIPYLGHHVGVGAGIQLSYILYDGRQKKIDRQQQLVLIDKANRQKELKYFEINNMLESYQSAIDSTRSIIMREMLLKKDYDELLKIYSDELENAQAGIMDYLNFLKQYSQNKLSMDLHNIELNRLISEYNYWGK